MKCILYYTDGTTYTLRGEDVCVWDGVRNNIEIDVTNETKVIDKKIHVTNSTRISIPKGLMLGYSLHNMDGAERETEVGAFSKELSVVITGKEKETELMDCINSTSDAIIKSLAEKKEKESE